MGTLIFSCEVKIQEWLDYSLFFSRRSKPCLLGVTPGRFAAPSTVTSSALPVPPTASMGSPTPPELLARERLSIIALGSGVDSLISVSDGSKMEVLRIHVRNTLIM